MNKHLLCICMAYLFLLCNHNLIGQIDGNHATDIDRDYLKNFLEDEELIDELSNIPTDYTYLPIQLYMVRKSDGSGTLSEDLVYQKLDTVNHYFEGSSVQFQICNIVNIDSDEFYDFDKKSNDIALVDDNYNEDAINLYCVGKLSDKGKVIDSYGSFPASGQFLAVLSEAAFDAVTPVAHQFGHLFGLLDTHEKSFGDQLANNSNCATSGDLLCDTPADPGLQEAIDGDCNYIGEDVDGKNNAFQPGLENIMSSAPNSCRGVFSKLQLQIVYASFNLSMQHLNCNYVEVKPNLVCKGRGSIKVKSDGLTVSNTKIINEGDAKSAGFYLGYFLSDDESFTRSDYLVGEYYFDPLYAGHTASANFSLKYEDLEHVPTGTYYLGLVIDYKNQINESNETDNYACHWSSPKVSIESKKSNLACYDSGKLTITDTKLKIEDIQIINNGEGPAGKSQIGYYLSKNETFTSADYRIGSAYIKDIAPGKTTDVSFSIDLDDIDVPVGSYYVGFTLDYSKKVIETDEYDNNDCYFEKPKLEIKKDKPNLTCLERGNLTLKDHILEIEDVWIKNDGYSKADESYVGLYLSKDKHISTSDYRIARKQIKALNEGAKTGASFWVNLKNVDVPSGTYYIGLYLDYLDEVAETDEKDNNDCFWQDPTVNFEEGKPNLACKERGNLKITGHQLEVTDIWLTNNGHSKAGESHLGLYLSKDKNITTSDYFVASKTIKALEAGEDAQAGFWIDLKDHDIPSGTYYVGLFLDHKNKVAEKDEYDNNDCYWVNPTVKIEEGKANLTCLERGWLKVDDKSIEITEIWLTNDGHAKAGASHLGLYLSKDKHISTSDYFLASKYIKALNPGQKTGAEFWVDLKDHDIPAGTYYIGLFLDYKKQVSEKDEYDNNDCYWDSPTVKIEAGKPNLTCLERGWLKVDDKRIEITEIWLTNNGDSKAGSSHLGLYLSKDKHISTTDYFIASKTIKALNPGQKTGAEFWVDLKDIDVPEGTYYLGLFLDYKKQVSEKDEYDNNDCYWVSPTVKIEKGKANLTCLERGWLEVDDKRLEITDIWLTNDGHSKAGASHLGLYLSKDKHISTTDYFIASKSIKALNPGQKTAAEFWVDLKDLDVPEGTYYVGLYLDYKNQVHEKDEYDNNDCYWTNPTVKIVKGKPNLTCLERGWIKVDDKRLEITDIWLTNNGHSKAGASHLGLYLSKDKHISTTDHFIASKSIKALNPGQKTAAEFWVDLKELDIPEGTYYVGLYLDYKNQVHEKDEYDNNDCYWVSPTVKIEKGKPNLACLERGWLKVDNKQIEITDIWLTNNGDSKAGASHLGLYLSKDKHITTTDYFIASKSINALNPGQNTGVNFWVDLKDLDIPAGSYYIGLYLDYKNQVHEKDEYDNNDCYWVNPTFTVEAKKPNLVCAEKGRIKVSGDDLEIADIWVRNNGEAKAGASHLGLYLSKDKIISTTDDVFLTSKAIKSLNPGQTTASSFKIDLRDYKIPAGTYYVGLYLDYKKQVDEKNEADNNDCFWEKPTVKIEGGKANLVCWERGWMSKMGKEIAISTIRIINDSPERAGASKLGLYLSKDPEVTPADYLIGTKSIKALNPGEMASTSFWVDPYDYDIPTGTYYLGLYIDYKHEVAERNEDDNNDCYWDNPKVEIVRINGFTQIKMEGDAAAVESTSIEPTDQFGSKLADSPSKVLNFNHLKTFPNPTTGIFTISGELKENTDITIEVRSIQGTMINSINLDQTRSFTTDFDLSNQSPGIYYVNVITDSGIEVKRVLLQ